MTHKHIHVSPSDFDTVLNIEEHPEKSHLSSEFESIQWFIESIRVDSSKALEWTLDMDGKLIWTPEWNEQARSQMNVNFMQAEFANTAQQVLYVPLEIFRQILKSQWEAFEILLDTNNRYLSIWNGSIAPVLSDKDDMFMYRTSLGKLDKDTPKRLEDTIWQIQERLKQEADMPKNPFFEWLRTSPDDIKRGSSWIVVEWYQKAHRIDPDWLFQQRLRESSKQAWKIIEWTEVDKTPLWNWEPRFSFKPGDQYYHLPR